MEKKWNYYKLVELSPELHSFLKERRLLGRFKLNVHTHSRRTYIDNIKDAFPWRFTSEGEIFWMNIYNDFYNYYKTR